MLCLSCLLFVGLGSGLIRVTIPSRRHHCFVVPVVPMFVGLGTGLIRVPIPSRSHCCFVVPLVPQNFGFQLSASCFAHPPFHILVAMAPKKGEAGFEEAMEMIGKSLAKDR